MCGRKRDWPSDRFVIGNREIFATYADESTSRERDVAKTLFAQKLSAVVQSRRGISRHGRSALCETHRNAIGTRQRRARNGAGTTQHDQENPTGQRQATINSYPSRNPNNQQPGYSQTSPLRHHTAKRRHAERTKPRRPATTHRARINPALKQDQRIRSDFAPPAHRAP